MTILDPVSAHLDMDLRKVRVTHVHASADLRMIMILIYVI